MYHIVVFAAAYFNESDMFCPLRAHPCPQLKPPTHFMWPRHSHCVYNSSASPQPRSFDMFVWTSKA